MNYIELITIIIPIYNGEKYLEDCLESVIFQTYKNLEIILVNDGSTDNSLSICEKYRNRDPRIVIVNKDNEGVSSARNIGLKMAKGKYIGFVDSDDILKSTMYENLLKECKENQAEIATCSRVFTNFKNFEKKEFISSKNTIDSKTALKKILKSKNMDIAIWDKLYERKLFENIRFETKFKNYEDIDIIFKLVSISKRISHTGTIEYIHRKRENSLSLASIEDKQVEDLLEILKNIKCILLKKFGFLPREYGNLSSILLLQLCISIEKKNNIKKTLKIKVKKEFNDNLIGLITHRKESIKNKVIGVLIYTGLYSKYLEYRGKK